MSEKRIKIKGMRKIIGDTMRESVLKYPSATGHAKVDMSELLRMKDELNEKNIKIAMSAFFIKAISIALEDYPELNSRIENDELVIYDSINVGVGTATDKGLYVLVVRSTQDKDIIQISDDLKDMLSRMKTGKLTMDDMQDGTITLSNLSSGEYDSFTSIITNDQAMIIGVAKTKKEVVVSENDEIVIKPLSNIMVNINHAATDGMPSSLFATKLIEVLENPYKYFNI